MATVSEDALGAAVRRFCPVFVLHEKEKHMPCSASWLLERAELRFLPNGRQDLLTFETLIPEGKVNETALVEEQAKRMQAPPHTIPNPSQVAAAKMLQLHISDQFQHGQPVSELNDVPIYAHSKAVVNTSGKVVAYEINYLTLYSWNGTYNVFGMPFAKAGAHPGDWEHITVRLFPNLEMQGVWYNTHRNRDGKWRPKSLVKVTASGRPVAYVANTGHGIYHRPGVQARVYYAANDVTSDKGPVWAARKVHWFRHPDVLMGNVTVDSRGSTLVALEQQAANGKPLKNKGRDAPTPLDEGLPVLVKDTSEWTAFRGWWGHVVAPVSQGWFGKAEPPVSRTYMQRLTHFADEVQTAPEEIIDAMQDLADSALVAAQDATQTVQDAAQGAAQTVQDATEGAVQTVQDAVSKSK